MALFNRKKKSSRTQGLSTSAFGDPSAMSRANQSVGTPASSEKRSTFLKGNGLVRGTAVKDSGLAPGPMSFAKAGPMSRERSVPTTTPSTVSMAGGRSVASTDTSPQLGTLTGVSRQAEIERQAGITPRTATPTPTVAQRTVAPTLSMASVPEAAPTVSPAQTRLDEARARFLESMAPSDDVVRQQRELADFQAGTAAGVAGEAGLGRGRTTGLVRGRQALLLEQRGIEEANRTAQLAISTQEKAQIQSMALAELGFAQEDVQSIISQQAPFTLSDGSVAQYDPTTGQVNIIREAPAGAAEPVTLSEGQVLVDPNTGQTIATNIAGQDPITVSAGQTVIDPNTGQVLFQAADKPETLPTSIQEYLFAAQQGYTGTFQDYQSQSAGAQTFSAEASKLIGNAQSGIGSIATMLKTVDANLGRGILGTLTNREYKAAEANLVDVIGRLRSGGAITEDEVKNFKKFLPDVRDSDELARTKLQNMESLLTDVMTMAGGAGGAASTGDTQQLMQQAGYDPNEYQQLIDAGYTDEQIRSELGFSNDLSTSVNSLGSLSEQFESGGDPGAIGYDRTGGYSYGVYQLAHNNAKEFVEQSPFAAIFSGITFNSSAWRQQWKNVASKYPDEFKQAQQDYIKQTHFDPQAEKLARAGIDVSRLPKVLLDVVWSTAVQHGPSTSIVVNALKQLPESATLADAITSIYRERWGGGANFASSTPGVQQAVYNRFFGENGELQQALNQIA